VHFRQKITLAPLNPSDVREDKMKEKYEQEKEKERKE